jgi:molybdopterin-guanine dinucleotide biosynthesis protein A
LNRKDERKWFMRICGTVLAGGQSRRMGTSKELLDWGGKPLLVHLAGSILEAGLPCLIVSNTVEKLPGEVLKHPCIQVVSDQVESHGPISGIVTAFQTRTEEALLVLSCDLPFLDAQQIGRIAGQADRLQHWDALVAQADGRLHPLLALYHRRTFPLWKKALADQEYRLFTTLERLKPIPLPEGLLDPWATFNANTPEDYQAALAEKKRREALHQEGSASG